MFFSCFSFYFTVCLCAPLFFTNPTRNEISNLQTNFEFLTNKINTNSQKDDEIVLTTYLNNNTNNGTNSLIAPTNINTNSVLEDTNYDKYDSAPSQPYFEDNEDTNTNNNFVNDYNMPITTTNFSDAPNSSTNAPLSPKEIDPPTSQIYNDPGKFFR